MSGFDWSKRGLGDKNRAWVCADGLSFPFLSSSQFLEFSECSVCGDNYIFGAVQWLSGNYLFDKWLFQDFQKAEVSRNIKLD